MFLPMSILISQVESLEDLHYLSDLPQLQVVNLEGNPVMLQPNARQHVIYRVPHLRILDNKVLHAKAV